MSTIDWTNYVDRKKIVDHSHTIINEIIQLIHEQKLYIHTQHKLTVDELALLYRWPIYVAVNIFIERFIRSVYFKKTDVSELNFVPRYYPSVDHSISVYYHDIKFNQKLMNDISIMISNQYDDLDNVNIEVETINNIYPSNDDIIKQQIYLRGISLLKRTAKRLICFLQKKRVQTIYFNDKQYKNIFSYLNRFSDIPYYNYELDFVIRGKIKECCKTAFEKNMSDYTVTFDEKKKNHLLDLFASVVDHILPFSIIESLVERLNHYQKELKGWDVRRIYSASGFYYSDNLKVFALLAKRKNALLIAQDDGICNFMRYFTNNNIYPTQYKGLNQVMFMNYYCVWGKEKDKVNDSWDSVEENYNTKIINTGSVYLSSLKKWKKSEIDVNNMTLLYPSGPLRDYMACLEEITPEKNFAHKINITKLLKRLLQKYSGLKVLYKTFPGIDSCNDPFMEILSEELDQGRVTLTSKHPVKLMRVVDIVLFDMISTGFAEAVKIGTPTLVYNNEFYYELASDEGKKINDKFENCGMVFYDTESGIKSFERIVNDLLTFQEGSKRTIRRFQEQIAYPVSKNEFIQNLKGII